MAGRVGIVGIGIMGTAMMRNLVKDGFEVVGYDIADGAMARLAEAGGIAATSPRDVAENAEILITSLPNVDAFEQVMAGQGGIASSNGTGQISRRRARSYSTARSAAPAPRRPIKTSSSSPAATKRRSSAAARCSPACRGRRNMSAPSATAAG
jgi:3-hydroxyisobutyrate dehydrogenase-like beta-hydroxyacid dehydrogenase